MQTERSELLSKFDEQVCHLEKAALWGFMAKDGWKMSWDFRRNDYGDDINMPTQTDIDAYALHLRLLIQKNEHISIRQLASHYQDRSVAAVFRRDFASIRNTINLGLNSQTPFVINGRGLTYRYFLHAFLYEELAHMNRKKSSVLQEMKRHPASYLLAMDQFLRAVSIIHPGAIMIRNLNRKAFPAYPQVKFFDWSKN